MHDVTVEISVGKLNGTLFQNGFISMYRQSLLIFLHLQIRCPFFVAAVRHCRCSGQLSAMQEGFVVVSYQFSQIPSVYTVGFLVCKVVMF